LSKEYFEQSGAGWEYFVWGY